MKSLVILLALAVLVQSPRRQAFTGIISDSMCGSAGHAGMRMGPTDAECTTACIAAHGALYVLVVGKNEYTLSDQRKPEAFAGGKVRVIGTLDAKKREIRVESIAAAK